MNGWRWPTWLVVAWLAGAFAFSYIVAQNDHPDAGANQLGRYTSSIFVPLALTGMLVLGPLWLFTRPRQPSPGKPATGVVGKCPQCGQVVDLGAKFCPSCGFQPGAPSAPGDSSDPSAPPSG
jgi:hypothetical protein